MPQHDSAQRRRAKRTGRQRGCWVYIPSVDLILAGLDLDAAPYYRTTGFQRSRNGHTVVVSLYREP